MFVFPSERQLILSVVTAGLLFVSGAVFLAVTLDDVMDALFRYVLTGWVILALVIWAITAMAARRMMIGKLQKMQLTSKAALAWGGTRIALLLSVAAALISWLAALAFGLGVEPVLLKAAVLLIVLTAFTGIIAGATINSMLVIKRLRESKVD